MTTATKNKPVIRKSDPKPITKKAKVSTFTPWTDEQVKIMSDAIAAAPTAAAGIKAAAKALGKKEGAVSQKYYSMKRTAAPKKAKKPKAARKGKPVRKPLAVTPKGMDAWMESRITLFDQQIATLSAERDRFAGVLKAYSRSH